MAKTYWWLRWPRLFRATRGLIRAFRWMISPLTYCFGSREEASATGKRAEVTAKNRGAAKGTASESSPNAPSEPTVSSPSPIQLATHRISPSLRDARDNRAELGAVLVRTSMFSGNYSPPLLSSLSSTVSTSLAWEAEIACSETSLLVGEGLCVLQEAVQRHRPKGLLAKLGLGWGIDSWIKKVVQDAGVQAMDKKLQAQAKAAALKCHPDRLCRLPESEEKAAVIRAYTDLQGKLSDWKCWLDPTHPMAYIQEKHISQLECFLYESRYYPQQLAQRIQEVRGLLRDIRENRVAIEREREATARSNRRAEELRRETDAIEGKTEELRRETDAIERETKEMRRETEKICRETERLHRENEELRAEIAARERLAAEEVRRRGCIEAKPHHSVTSSAQPSYFFPLNREERVPYFNWWSYHRKKALPSDKPPVSGKQVKNALVSLPSIVL